MTQFWKKHFYQTATFYQVKIRMVGAQQTKVSEVLYSEIPCNLVKGKTSKGINYGTSQNDRFEDEFRCDVSGEYNGASVGDLVTIEGQTYAITRIVIDRDFNGRIVFAKYVLDGDVIDEKDVITNITAVITGSSTVQANTLSSYNATASSDLDGNTITAWEWSITGNGTINSGASSNICVVLPTTGSFTLSLRVMNSKGNWSLITTKIVTVTAPPPPLP